MCRPYAQYNGWQGTVNHVAEPIPCQLLLINNKQQWGKPMSKYEWNHTRKGRHPKTNAVIRSYLRGKSHKEVAREHDVPYTTCVDICNRYIVYLPFLKKPMPPAQGELDLD